MLNISEIIQTIKQLIDVRVKLVQDSIQEHLSVILARVLMLVFMGAVSLLILFFLSFALAYYIGQVTYSPAKGFLYVALFYLVVLLLLYLVKDNKKLVDPIKAFMSAFLFRNRS